MNPLEFEPKKGQKIGAIIQARLTSTREPGKVMLKLGGQTIVGNIIMRLRKCKKLDEIILAIPDNKENDGLVRFEEFYDVKIFRGSEADVLSRFIGAGEAFNLQHIVRICADSPYPLPGFIDYMVEVYQQADTQYLYTDFMLKGQNVEIMSLEVLKHLYERTNEEEKEHVTSYLAGHPGLCKAMKIPSPGGLVVDYSSDYEWLKKLNYE